MRIVVLGATGYVGSRLVPQLLAAGHTAGAIGTIEEGTGVRDVDGRSITWPERDELARLPSP